MKPQTPTPPPKRQDEARPAVPQTQADQSLDREIDQELDDTFPASDPLPWSHEVK